MALEFEGKARHVGGETRTPRFALAARGEERALVGEAAPAEGDVGAVLDRGAEIEGRGERGAVGAHGVGREVGVGEVDDDKRAGVGGIVGGVFGALGHDTEAHGVERGEQTVGAPQHQSGIGGHATEHEGEEQGEEETDAAGGAKTGGGLDAAVGGGTRARAGRVGGRVGENVEMAEIHGWGWAK